MSGEDRKRRGWRRWREIVLAACAVWLVIQNVVILTLVLWANPASALAAGAAIARTAFAMGSQLAVLAMAVVLALALTAWLVQAPAAARDDSAEEAGDVW